MIGKNMRDKIVFRNGLGWMNLQSTQTKKYHLLNQLNIEIDI